MTTNKVCSVEDCSKLYYAKGYCRMHYARQLRNGDIELRRPQKARRLTETCSVEGCEKPYYARGFCRSHYCYQRRYGDLFLGLHPAVAEQDSKVSSEIGA